MASDELTALTLMAEGKQRAEVAQALGTTVRGLESVRTRLFAKLGARTDPHAAAIGFRRGLIALDRRGQRGQVMVLSAIAMVGICAMAGFSVDVASW